MARRRLTIDSCRPNVQKVLRQPWLRHDVKLSRLDGAQLRRWLNARGLITPNFSWAEARSKDGKPVPRRLRRKAIEHAWRLERLRHALGDKPLGILSWYRSPSHNRAVGGASKSQHMQACATDLSPGTIQRAGRDKLMQAAERIWPDGGIGDYPSGAVHVDSRGHRARWTSH